MQPMDPSSDPAAPGTPSDRAPSADATSEPPANPYSGSRIEGIAIMLWACEPENPHRLVTPFHHAAAAAAMELKVEMYFTAHSVLLLQPGVAAGLRAAEHIERSVLDAMRDAHELGAKFFSCNDALAARGLDRKQLISEHDGPGGAVRFIGRAADPRWRTLVF